MNGDVLAVVLGVLGGLLAAVGPRLIARLPEPELDLAPEEGGEADTGGRLTIKPVYEKVTYAEVAARPHLALLLAVAGVAVGVLLGLRLGATAELAVVLPLVPAGVWLGYVDARTTFLPTKLIYPTLAATALVVVVCGLVESEGEDLLRALIGCLLYGCVFFVMWWITPGFGFGDVRLAFLLGLALGFLGWPALVLGFMGGLFLGGFGGGLLALLKVIDARRNPFGPYMLVAALIAAGFGPEIADLLGY